MSTVKGRQLPSRFRSSVMENKVEAQFPPDALRSLWLRRGWESQQYSWRVATEKQMPSLHKADPMEVAIL